jgi:hypothetical protein
MKRNPFKLARTIAALIVALVFVVSFCGEVFARGSSGSRSSSSGSSRSFSSSSSSSRASSSTSTSTKSTPSSSSSGPAWGGKSDSAGITTSGSRGDKTTPTSSSKPDSKSGTAAKAGSSSAAPMSKADKALYEQAKTKGTAFKTRDEAVNTFKQQNESKYKNQFSSEPAQRPNYVPEYYSGPGGARYNVTYRSDLGGYGYYNPSLGQWMLYSAMADAVMVNSLMHSHGYYYGPPPVRYGGGWGFFTWLGMLIFILLIAYAVTRMFHIRRV